ncbi:CBS-domain-containing protein [Rhodotorula sp. JG-1b]|nr:CBS-domain-containing protein [Rhodotorula sp. JG-1b]
MSSRPQSSRSAYSQSGSSYLSTTSTVPSTPPASSDGLAETRKRQSKRDEAIRKKIEGELSRKRPGSKRAGAASGTTTGGQRVPRPKQGTVSALRPLPALTVPHGMSVSDASQLCAAKRTDCVLVVDEDEHLCGIFTAKDLAFRVVGDGMDPRVTPVSAIMTPNPMVTRDTTSATEALQTMVTRGFRHLPVCNEDGDVVGLLDITKVFHESLEKLEKAYGSSQRLYTALEGAQEQFGGADAAATNPLLAYVQALRDKMSFPDLGSILDARTTAATVGVKTSVRDAAKLMREKRTTAVCVVEGDGKKIAGIFTSKDVVLRVIAAGLDAKTCSVVRVMTPHPDVALPTLSIQDALRKMHDGHYLNLPVVDEVGALIGIVDVLKLTYATLEQVNTLHADAGGAADPAGGPLWGRFFSAAAEAGGVDDDVESVLIDTPGSELFPGDSASVVNADDASDVGVSHRGGPHASSVGGISQPATTIVDDGTYLFKFVAPGGTTHRFQARYDSHEFLIDIVSGKLASDPFFASSDASPSPSAEVVEASVVVAQEIKPDPKDFQVSYRDDDGDLVLMTADRDVTDAVQTAKQQGKDRVVLHVSGGSTWKQAIAAAAVKDEKEREKAKAATVTKKLVVVEEEAADVEAEGETDAAESGARNAAGAREGKKARKAAHAAPADDLVAGILPKEYLLPASIGFLGVVIATVFIASRAGASAK